MGALWSWLKLILVGWLIVVGMKTTQRYLADANRKEEGLSHIQIMEKMGIQCPKVVCCQMLLETADLTSKIYRENNNGFGMKYNQRGHAVGVLNGHAKYETIYESILDYKDWQKRWFKDRVFTSDEEYMYALQHLPGGYSYAEDSKYIDKLRIKYNKYYKKQ